MRVLWFLRAREKEKESERTEPNRTHSYITIKRKCLLLTSTTKSTINDIHLFTHIYIDIQSIQSLFMFRPLIISLSTLQRSNRTNFTAVLLFFFVVRVFLFVSSNLYFRVSLKYKLKYIVKKTKREIKNTAKIRLI